MPTTHAPLFIDIAGTELQAIDRERLAHPLVGGLTLFARNWQDRRQLTRLCADIKAVRRDLLICVDQEGGRVQRFRGDGFTTLPPMRALGQLWLEDSPSAPRPDPSKRPSVPADEALPPGAQRAIAAATACGYVLASELRACGVDLSFTPVVDLDWGGSTVIGDRAFAPDAATTARLAQALIHGLRQAGMQHCAKHFPGHGYVQADSHTDIPYDQRPLQAILQDDAAPYAWLQPGLAAVMAAHVVYPQVDERPAGFSARWLTDILRGQLGFDGAIFSDDLSMAGAAAMAGRSLSAAEAAIAALHAGCDLLLLCNQSLHGGAALDAWLGGMHTALQTGQWQPNPHSERRRQALLPTTPAPGWDALMQAPAYQQALAQLP